jgi:hypothetical protein
MCLRLLRITLTVACFPRANLQSSKVLSQGFADQCGTIQLGPACCSIRGLQQFFIENNLDCFHMSTPFHSIFHSLIEASVWVLH